MRHTPLVASYKKDVDWCFHLLTSLRLNARGFEPPVVVVPSADKSLFEHVVAPAHPGARILCTDVPPHHKTTVWADFMRAQIAMMSGDIHCPEADIVWLFGSDCFVNEPLVPEQLLHNGKPVMAYSTYDELLKGHPACLCWREGTRRALGFTPENEFMRRLPLLYPRSLYASVREAVSGSNRIEMFEDVVYRRGAARNFSESNVLGAWAWKHAHDLYEWFLVDGEEYSKIATRFPTSTIQFWSHGGLDKQCDRYHALAGETPRAAMDRFYAQARERLAKQA